MEEYYFYNSTAPVDLKDKTANPTMLQYLTELDPIRLKYSINRNETLNTDAKDIASRHENLQQFGYITKREYSFMMENLKLVYGSGNSEVQDDIEAYHRVEERIIYGYLGLPQLNKMFDEDYFNFEWDMHVGQNFREHRNDYYRDHFVHQIRNLYMMLVLLDEFDFFEACNRIFHNRNGGKLSEYVFKKWWGFQENSSNPQIETLKKMSRVMTRDETEYIEKFFYKYVIYASSMMAALFHDMGYPITHFLEVRHRTSDYSPSMYMFTHNAVDSFDQLASKLGASLLFTIVSSHEIRQRLEISEKGQYDHGAYSAIAFLLQFYENGLIFSLPQEKQCAIELAALAIYNHTSKFNRIDKKNRTNYYSLYFRQSPISFLLRMCDDLQEWDRRYFEISDSSDLMFCRTCGMPLLKQQMENAKDPNGRVKSVLSKYCCSCEKTSSVIRPDIFKKRKLYLVTVADWVRMEVRDRNRGEKELLVSIDYDPYKLLMLSKINRAYAKHRLKDLREVKRLLSGQNYAHMSDNALRFSTIRVECLMTANPLLIKLKILERFIREIDWELNSVSRLSRPRTDEQVLGKIQNLYKLKTPQNEFLAKIFSWPDANEIRNPKDLRRYLVTENALSFYLALLYDCISCSKTIEKQQDNIEFLPFRKYYEPLKDVDPQYYTSLKMLVEDSIEQYKKESWIQSCARWREKTATLSDEQAISEEKLQQKKELQELLSKAQEKYDTSYVSSTMEDALYHQIGIYTDSENFFNMYRSKNSKKITYIGYFKDIQLFYRMNRITRYNR